MKTTIIILAAILAMATPALAGLNIKHQLGFSTIEGGNSAPVVDVRITNMFNNHFGIMAGGLVAGEVRQIDTSSTGTTFKAIESNLEHRGIFAGVSIAMKSMTIATGAIHLDIDGQETTESTDFSTSPAVVTVSAANLSKSLTRPFCALNYKEKLSGFITLNAGLMSYEVDDDFVFNVGVGAVLEF